MSRIKQKTVNEFHHLWKKNHSWWSEKQCVFEIADPPALTTISLHTESLSLKTITLVFDVDIFISKFSAVFWRLYYDVITYCQERHTPTRKPSSNQRRRVPHSTHHTWIRCSLTTMWRVTSSNNRYSLEDFIRICGTVWLVGHNHDNVDGLILARWLSCCWLIHCSCQLLPINCLIWKGEISFRGKEMWIYIL